MAGLKRKPFEGVLNILKFNWHFFALASGAMVLLLFSGWVLPPVGVVMVRTLLITIGFSVVLSLAASHYIYDRSGLYALNWLNHLQPEAGQKILNLHAGFDETSFLLAEKYPDCPLQVYDFYNPLKHTEVSIKRARKAALPYPGTLAISTAALPVQPERANLIFLILAAHEIRDMEERTHFFRLLSQGLTPEGQLIVVEHLRDLPNFLVYNVGFFHFLPESEWRQTFSSAGFRIERELKITVFVRVYFLQFNGNPS